MKKYIIKSESADGVYYLCNGWQKRKSYWVKPIHWDMALFNAPGQAKASLTKLRNSIELYSEDKFTLCEFIDSKAIPLYPLEFSTEI